MREVRTSSWPRRAGCVALMGLLCSGCALSTSPRQMYDGAPLPEAQVGIVRSGCVPEGGLNIMVLRIDGKEISDICGDFALLPGDHEIELSAEQVAPRLAAPTMSSGGVLGAPPSAIGGVPQQGSQVVWQSPTKHKITCTVHAGTEINIIGTSTSATDWTPRCQERAR